MNSRQLEIKISEVVLKMRTDKDTLNYKIAEHALEIMKQKELNKNEP